MRHHARVETQCFFYVYIHTDAGNCTVVVERVIAFSHGEAYARIASLATDSTRDAAHTEGEPGEDGLDGRLYILSSLSPIWSPSTPIRSLTHYLSVCLFLHVSLSFFHAHELSLPSSGRRRTHAALPSHAFTRPLTKENPSTPTNRTTFQPWWGWRESTTTDIKATSLSLFRS